MQHGRAIIAQLAQFVI